MDTATRTQITDTIIDAYQRLERAAEPVPPETLRAYADAVRLANAAPALLAALEAAKEVARQLPGAYTAYGHYMRQIDDAIAAARGTDA